jgi:hypothetical protein
MLHAFFNFEYVFHVIVILIFMQARTQFMQYILSKGDLYAMCIIILGIFEDPDKS